MKTRAEIEKEFMEELSQLFRKYGANLTADDHYPGYPESGEDIRMTVEIPSQFEEDGMGLASERTEIDLGKYFDPNVK